MTINVIESLLKYNLIEQTDLAQRFAHSYQWSRGYGPGAAKLLKKIRRGQSWEIANKQVFSSGSFGNGGAMRAPVVGLFFANQSIETIIKSAFQCAEITHAHPFGMEGAGIIALATALAYRGEHASKIIETLCSLANSSEFKNKLGIVQQWLASSVLPDSRQQLRKDLGNGILALESCASAVYIALIFIDREFEVLVDYTQKLGGDVDTIAAMAGAIWGAANGFSKLPETWLGHLEQYERIKDLAISLADIIQK